MKITRIYTGEDEQSHFEEIEIPLFDQGDIGRLSEIFSASGVIFRENPGDYHYQWPVSYTHLTLPTRLMV